MLGIFLDTETSGLNPRQHRVLEVAYKIVDVCTGEVRESFHAVVKQTREAWGRADRNSLKINAFTWEETERGIPEQEVSEKIRASFGVAKIKRGQAVFICQNPSFDRPFFQQLVDVEMQEELLWPYHWLDLASMFWVRCMIDGSTPPWKSGLSKNSIAVAYGLATEEMPHRAMQGVDHLLLCYDAVVGFPDPKGR